MDSAGNFYQGIFNQSNLSIDSGELVISGLADNKVVGSIGQHLTTNTSTDWLAEGSTNKYYTDTRARNAVSGGIGIIYAPSTGLIANDGVINVIGTTNQITAADDGFGGITLSTPQDIATSSSVQFARVLNSSINVCNLIFGTQAGNSYNGPFSVICGHQACYVTQSASELVAVGYKTLFNCTGSRNTALGSTAGYNCTTGTDNIFLGQFSGRGTNALTTGTFNIYLGVNSFPSSTSSNREIVIGSGTGAGSDTAKIYASSGLYVSNLTSGLLKSTSGKIEQATTTDITNVLYGLSPSFARILNSTISTINVLVGTNAGSALTTGDANVAIGHNSLASNQTSTRNVAVGMQSLYACIGNFNAACGSDSAFSLTTGSKNSFLGYDSGNGSTPLTIGTYNIYLGSEAYSSASNVNREIVIGQGTGKGSNTALINASSGLYVSNLTNGLLKSTSGMINQATSSDLVSALQGTSVQFNTLSITALNDNISNGLSLGSSAGTSGNYNIYLGHQAGTSSVGSNNVGIGYQSLAGAGSQCFGLGFTAGYNAQTNGNVCIGNSSGQNILTGSGYNLYLGSGAAPSSSTAQYEIVIGGAAAGVVGKGNSTCFINAGSGLYVANLTNGLLKTTSGMINQATSSDLVSALQGTSVQFARLLNSTQGTSNSLIGTSSGNQITTASYNIAIGENSLSQITTNLGNIGIGHEALKNITTDYNTAVGYKSGTQMTTGLNNSMFGGNTGRNMTTGANNNLFGISAGFNISSGANNTCVGTNAGFSLTTGNYNTAIGSYAFGNATTNMTDPSGYNVAVGYQAGLSCTSGVGNVIVGGLSAVALTTGINNTIVGKSSMTTNTTGSHNTILGYNSGIGINGGGFNIHIGAGCSASVAGVSSEIIIAGTSGTTVGKGAGTCYISSPYGLFAYSPVLAQFTFINTNPQIAVNAGYLPYYSYGTAGTGSVQYFNRGITLTTNLNSTIGGYWQFQQTGIYKITVSMNQYSNMLTGTTFIGKTPTLGSTTTLTNVGNKPWSTNGYTNWAGWTLVTLVNVSVLTDYYFISEYYGIAVNSNMNNNSSVLIEYVSVG